MIKTWTREQRYRPLESLSASEYQDLATRIATAPWRQRYHIQPPTGLLNDPNGFCYDGKQYHLFYQWFPLGATHGLKYWRALTSPDLVTFSDQGIAIKPETELDSHGAYSGSALASPDGNLTLAYTGNHRTADWQRIAYQLTATYNPSNHSLTRHPPFLSGAPAGYTEHIRDPKIWHDGNDLYAIIGAQRSNLTGTALLTKNGVLLGELHTALHDFGYMWECPDLFPLDGKTIFTFSPQGLAADGDNNRNLYQNGYLIGELNLSTCTLQHGDFHELDHGFEFYAAQSTAGANGSRILIAWMGMPDTTYPSDNDDWQGCLTLPRVLSLENSVLKQRPLPALNTLRGDAITNPSTLSCGELELKNPEATPFTLDLFADEQHRTRLHYDGHHLTFDRSQSGALPSIQLTPIPLGKTQTTRRLAIQVRHLQIFLDTSSIEIFINDGEATMTARIFAPTSATGIHIHGAAQLIAYPYQAVNFRQP